MTRIMKRALLRARHDQRMMAVGNEVATWTPAEREDTSLRLADQGEFDAEYRRSGPFREFVRNLALLAWCELAFRHADRTAEDAAGGG